METVIVLLVLLFFILPVVSVIMVIRQKDRISLLEDQNADIRYRLKQLEHRMSPEPGDFPLQESAAEPAESPSLSETPLPEPVEMSPPAGVVPFKKMKSPGKMNPLLVRLEHQFLENWTGILGSVIMVLGAGFLSIYAALRFEEFVRFLLLLLLSAIPAVLFYILKDREKWQRQALWLRSISGAIFLFACLGSAGIPGLQWVHNPIQSMGLLFLGIAVNLGLSSLGRREEYASFHSLLGLLALSVMAPGSSSLVMAVIITLYALIHCYRNRWDVHFLLIITGFAAYHIYWMFSLQGAGIEALSIQGAAALSLIFLVSTFVHYRKSYATPRFEILPFLTHLVNWLYFSVGMYLYIGGKPERSLVLLAGSILAFTLSRRAGRKGVAWLQSTSIVMSQLLFTATLISLRGWDVQPVMIGGFIYVEILLFLWTMIRQNRHRLYRFSVFLHAASTAALLFLCLKEEGLNSFIYAGALMVLGLVQHRTLFHMKDKRWLEGDSLLKLKGEFSLTGILAGLSGVVALILIPQDWIIMSWVTAGIFSLLILAAYHDSPTKGLRTGTLVFLTVMTAVCFITLLEQNITIGEETVISLALASAAVLTLFWKKDVHPLMSYAGLLICTGTIIILSWMILNPLSTLLPGAFWLVCVILIMEITKTPERFKTMAVIFLAAFTIRHFSVHLDNEQSWGFFRMRYILDGAYLAAIFLWRRRYKSVSHPVLKGIMNFSMDAGYLLALVLTAIEVPVLWVPAVLALFSLSIILFRIRYRNTPRILFYSFMLYLLSLTVLFVNLLMQNKGFEAGAAGILALLLQLTCLVFFILKEDFNTLTEKEAYRKAAAFLERGKTTILLYSLALTGALFLYVMFDPAYLTLLWAMECFLIFTASLFLGESHFRAVSQGGLLLCVVRLIFIDLSESAPLLKGLVFLAVGLLMLGTNSLYNRYRERFNKTGPVE